MGSNRLFLREDIMSKLKFTDGVEFEVSGRFRVVTRIDGFYVVGNDMLIPVGSRKEGDVLVAELKEKYA